PVSDYPCTIGDDAGCAAGEARVKNGDSFDAVFEKCERIPDHHELQPSARRQWSTAISVAKLSPATASASLVDHQLRIAVVPGINAHVPVLPAILQANRRSDPLTAGELRQGHLDLRVLIAAVCLSGAYIPADPCASSHHGLGQDRQSTVGRIRPVGPERAVR